MVMKGLKLSSDNEDNLVISFSSSKKDNFLHSKEQDKKKITNGCLPTSPHHL